MVEVGVAEKAERGVAEAEGRRQGSGSNWPLELA